MQVVESVDKKDIIKVMDVVATFGANPEVLNDAKSYIESELEELGSNRVLLFAEKEGVTVACVQLLLEQADRDPRLATKGSIAHVHALQVAKQYQRQGIASFLMNAAEQWLRAKGYKFATLGVDSDNSAALALYEKLGYSLLYEAEGRDDTVSLFYKIKKLV